MKMRQWKWNLLPLALLFLFQLLVAGAHVTTENKVTPPTATQPAESGVIAEQNGLGLKFSHGRHEDSSSQPAVDAAINLLQRLKIPTRKYNQPSGFLWYARHYAREAFYLLFMNGPPLDNQTQKQPRKMSSQLKDAVSLLESAAKDDNSDAIYLLAEMNFYGNYTHPRNYSKAFQHYEKLAKLTGNSTAQYMLGFMYATGIGDAVERHQGMALLYHTFAAMGGNTKSQMTLAFRRYSGIGTPRNCDEAAFYYKQVADKAIAYYRSGPPGGRTLSKDSYRWADAEGGVYGEGASVSSSGVNAHKDGVHSGSDANLDDVLEYLDLLAKKGDLKATFNLGKLYYDGSRHLPRNLRKSMMYFGIVARRYWMKDGKLNPNRPVGLEKIASKSAAHIGLMFLRGEGTEQNFEKAFTWFKRGTANGDSMCQHYMGLMYLHGYGIPQDALKAASYFKAASESDYPYAEIRLGALFLDQGDVPTATRYFELAARYGATEAFYFLAEIAERGIGKERHCGMATGYYKMVAERVEEIHSSFAEANEAYKSGDKETALVLSMMAAEQGYEIAQANVAWLLDERRSVLSLDPILPWSTDRRPSILRNAALALIYWTRSAKQANIDSLVKMGDYYFYGNGAPQDFRKASSCYHSAAEGHHSAQAFWNLGWMHEHGIAVEQDFHMAKRYYDLALETNDEAYLPVKLSLIRLRLRSFWNRITNGKVNSIQEERDQNSPRTFKEWIRAFVSYDEEREAVQKEKSRQAAAGEQGEDALEDTADSRGTSGDRESYYDELDLDIEDGMLESLVILGLAATLVVLLHFRQQRAMRRANNPAHGNNNNNPSDTTGQAAAGGAPETQQQGRQGGDEDRGLFPAPDDPEYPAWIAGAIGR
ncbi:ERAD-associated protein [Coccidioides immitis]|uniref:ERAD-associated E3 ubiquitin-protein ligase component HRD3 n=1 Tax=Coccidioides immitis RMSCC 2394 TaxID=404692 RepID=A0A0J6YIJ5_COCIT|nr:ERAD-associated E3 ubiquitin-protein ligase component HRD3 [Coccidioides immitis RMSCC 2394]TPX19391.1 ERAD-associated protein [Coccidioides immitis]